MNNLINMLKKYSVFFILITLFFITGCKKFYADGFSVSQTADTTSVYISQVYWEGKDFLGGSSSGYDNECDLIAGKRFGGNKNTCQDECSSVTIVRSRDFTHTFNTKANEVQVRCDDTVTEAWNNRSKPRENEGISARIESGRFTAKRVQEGILINLTQVPFIVQSCFLEVYRSEVGRPNQAVIVKSRVYIGVCTTNAFPEGEFFNMTDTSVSPDKTYEYWAQLYSSTIKTKNFASSERVRVAPAADDGPIPTPPAAPTSLVLSNETENSIDLDWVDQSSDEEGFRIERSLNGSVFTQIADTNMAEVESFTDTGLNPSTTYYYRVFAYNDDGSSAYSNTANATTGAAGPPGPPNAPSNLVGFPDVMNSPEITLTWQDNSSDETGFEIERSTVGGGVGFANIETTGPNETLYQDTTAAGGTVYYYRIRAVNVSGDSAYTAEEMVNN